MATDIAIGIDLGTTNSCIAVWRDGEVEIIPNNLGKRTTPSYVAFTDSGPVYGDDAKKEAAKYPATTIYDAKRLIGRRFSDPIVQGYIKSFPFKVIEDSDEPKIEIKYKGATHGQYAPEEVSAMILAKLKDFAEAYLGTPVKDVVITVPANFSDSQRRATRSAGEIAGLNVLRIINEPMAAAIAYGLDKKASRKGAKKVLVFDLGGGTLDVCIIILQEEEFIVKAVTGRTDIGGRDFDRVMVNHLKLVVKQKHDKDISSSDTKALRRLRTACEDAKKHLSESKKAPIEIDPLVDDINFEYTISREEFVGLNLFLFDMCMESVNFCLSDAKMTREDIDDVVLVGGSTRIPYVRKMLQDFFGEEKISTSINPDEAVAYGAAIHAGMLSKNAKQKVPDLVKLVEVTPLSLGVEVVKSEGKMMDVLIQKSTQVPAYFEKTFTTVRDRQRVVEIVVLEGEEGRSENNLLLDKIELQGIPLAPSGKTRIIVRFAIDAEGILDVTARVESANIERAIKITKNRGKLSQRRVEQIAQDIEHLQRIEGENKRLMAARNALQEHIQDLEAILKNMRISSETRYRASSSIRRATALKNKTTTTTTTTTEVISEYENMAVELDTLLQDITLENSGEDKGLRLVSDEDDDYHGDLK